jgi:hypothetical protein
VIKLLPVNSGRNWFTKSTKGDRSVSAGTKSLPMRWRTRRRRRPRSRRRCPSGRIIPEMSDEATYMKFWKGWPDIEWLFTFAGFFKMTVVAEHFCYFFHSTSYVLIVTKHSLGYILGDFLLTHLVTMVLSNLGSVLAHFWQFFVQESFKVYIIETVTFLRNEDKNFFTQKFVEHVPSLPNLEHLLHMKLGIFFPNVKLSSSKL